MLEKHWLVYIDLNDIVFVGFILVTGLVSSFFSGKGFLQYVLVGFVRITISVARNKTIFLSGRTKEFIFENVISIK